MPGANHQVWRLRQPRIMALPIDAIRTSMKSGPFRAVYASVRQLKRRLMGDPESATPTAHLVPLDRNGLIHLAEELGLDGRLLFSIGLAYLDRNEPGDALRALACLRSAEWALFESEERTRLHKARSLSRLNLHADAIWLVEQIDVADLTAEEREMREEVIRAADSLPVPEAAQTEDSPKSILAVGDSEGVSSTSFSHAQYLALDRTLNGLTLRAIEDSGAWFDLCLSSGDRPADEGRTCWDRWEAIRQPGDSAAP
jgi:hypothetical protein